MYRTSAAGRRPGLTLIEIIVVMAIITILITITVAMGQHVINANNRKATETTLEAISSAAERYRIQRGYWPWEETAAGYTYGGLPPGQTSAWEIELTRSREPNGAVRDPFFSAGTPTLREICLPHNKFGTANGQPQDGMGTLYATEGGWGNFDTPSGGYNRIFDQWGNRIYLNLPNSVIGQANQGMPVFQSAGPDGNYATFTAANLFQNVDDVFSHCGTD